jgi:hypothetical protein
MSASMATQGSQVQLEQSLMHLAWNMARLANGELLCAALEEIQQLIKRLRVAVQDEIK